MNNPYDVEEIRKMMPVVAAEHETCGYCGHTRDLMFLGPCPETADGLHSWDFDFSSLLDEPVIKDLRIQVHQLNERITELQAASKAQDRCIRVVIVGTVFSFAMLVFTIRMFWM